MEKGLVAVVEVVVVGGEGVVEREGVVEGEGVVGARTKKNVRARRDGYSA